MESAFGIDHGEVSKALPPGLRRIQTNRVNRRARQNRKAERQLKVDRTAAKVQAVPGKIKAAGTKAVNAEISAAKIGRGVGYGFSTTGAKVNQAVSRYPGTTGAAVVGAGSYGLYRSGRKRNGSQ